MTPRPRKKAKAGYMISAVAELYQLHPQTCASTSASACSSLPARKEIRAFTRTPISSAWK